MTSRKRVRRKIGKVVAAEPIDLTKTFFFGQSDWNDVEFGDIPVWSKTDHNELWSQVQETFEHWTSRTNNRKLITRRIIRTNTEFHHRVRLELSKPIAIALEKPILLAKEKKAFERILIKAYEDVEFIRGNKFKASWWVKVNSDD